MSGVQVRPIAPRGLHLGMTRWQETWLRLRTLEWIPSWKRLNDLGKSRTLRSSLIWIFIVPIVAKFLQRFPQEITIRLNETDLVFSLQLPFSWTLLFYSSVFFAAASLVYGFNVPELIREYDDYESFTKSGMIPFSISGPFISAWHQSRQPAKDHFLLDVGIRSFNEMDHLKEVSPYILMSELSRLSDIEVDKHLFWFTYDYWQSSRPIARISCTVLYTLGFSYLGIVILRNFQAVISVSPPFPF